MSGSISWSTGETAEIACRACATTGTGEVVGTFSWPFPSPHPVPLVRCGTCGTVVVRGEGAPDYRVGGIGGAAVRFYVEQGAGVDFLADQAEIVAHQRIESYCELGCGFGFSLDYARRARGWRVLGVDPSASARTGAKWLGVPIEGRYATREAPPTGGPFDVMAAYEVIEHVEDVDGFLAAMVSGLAQHGTVLLTTPNAAALSPETGPGTLFAILSPGYHLTHFTADGLRAALERAGFPHVEIEATPHTLRAAASRVPLDVRWDAKLDRNVYLDYLLRRMGELDSGQPAWFGMVGRAIRETSREQRWSEQSFLLGQYGAALEKAYGHRLAEPASIIPGVDGEPTAWRPLEFVTRIAHLLLRPTTGAFDRTAAWAPFNLGMVLHAQAMRELLHLRRVEQAQVGFEAADRCLAFIRSGLRLLGSEDGEAELLQGEARLQWLPAKVVREGASALSDRMFGGDPFSQLDPMRAARLRTRLVGELVARGELVAARALAMTTETIAATSEEPDAHVWWSMAQTHGLDAGATAERVTALRTVLDIATKRAHDLAQQRVGMHAAIALSAIDPAEAAERLGALLEAADPDLRAKDIDGLVNKTLAEVIVHAVQAGALGRAQALLAHLPEADRPQTALFAWSVGILALNHAADYPVAAAQFERCAVFATAEGNRSLPHLARLHAALAQAYAGEDAAARRLRADVIDAIGAGDELSRIGADGVLEAISARLDTASAA
jgi:SAM-dependent methyltransferase